MVLSLLACVTSLNGVLVVEDDELLLYRSDAPTLSVRTTEQSRELQYLGDCTVELEGRQVGRRLTVEDWAVLAAADGSAPYVGVLRVDGSRLLVDDRNSGATYVLEGRDELRAHAGRTVLVIGFVSGPQVVQVMGWRVLEEVD